MDFSNMSPAVIVAELGERLKLARLNQNLSQRELAGRAGVSRKVVVQAEKGLVTLESLVALLLSLGLVEQLNQFLPKPSLSPIQLAKLQGKQRQRASRRKTVDDEELPEW